MYQVKNMDLLNSCSIWSPSKINILLCQWLKTNKILSLTLMSGFNKKNTVISLFLFYLLLLLNSQLGAPGFGENPEIVKMILLFLLYL